MIDRIKRWLGIDKTSPYVKRYFEASNARSSIYMSIIIIALETMLIVNIISIISSTTVTRSPTWVITHLVSYVILFASGAVALLYADRFLRGEKTHSVVGQVTLWVFSLVCILFGMYISYTDFMKGEQILTFITMVLFVGCLLVWKPVISVSLETVSFLVFYLLISAKAPLTNAMKINYVITWISICVTSISIYNQKRIEAEKDESLEDANEHLSKTALIDDLTGVANMNFFRKRSVEMLAEAEGGPESMIFLYVDIENFKALNEKYGFEAGNAFLKKFAGSMADIFYNALIARQADDHFVILTDRSTYDEQLTELRSNIYNFGGEAQMGLKAGGYVPETVDCDPYMACDKARYACNSIKKHYEQDFREYDDQLEDEANLRQYIMNNIDVALDRGDIKVYYQPVVWAKTRKLCGYEALTKWQDPNYGFIPPSVFIPVLEEYRQVHKLDMIVVQTVCRDIRNLMNQKRPTVPVSINFSRLDFELSDVPDLVESCITNYKIPRDMLHIEVTESALSGELDSLHMDLDKLKRLGYPLWLDDFGSGFSSLNVLKDFEFDVLKIDMVFLSSFESNKEKTKTVIKNVVTMANELGMHTLTEGVETMEEAEYLKSVGCERLQGYLFGKPMPLRDALVKIAAGTLPVSEEFLDGCSVF